jgi:hypothetical protein
MGKRFATYTSAFVFLLSSVAFACPDFYNFSSLIRPSSLKAKVMDHNPCRDMDDNTSQSPATALFTTGFSLRQHFPGRSATRERRLRLLTIRF